MPLIAKARLVVNSVKLHLTSFKSDFFFSIFGDFSNVILSVIIVFCLIRFMDSELELNDEIQKLHVIATVPHLYHHIVEVNAVGTILGLLSHENSGTC